MSIATNYLSIIVTDIPLKPHQFLASSFWAACYLCCSDLDLGPMTLSLNRELDILKMCLRTDSEVATSSHWKYIAWIEKVQK